MFFRLWGTDVDWVVFTYPSSFVSCSANHFKLKLRFRLYTLTKLFIHIRRKRVLVVRSDFYPIFIREPSNTRVSHIDHKTDTLECRLSSEVCCHQRRRVVASSWWNKDRNLAKRQASQFRIQVRSLEDTWKLEFLRDWRDLCSLCIERRLYELKVFHP